VHAINQCAPGSTDAQAADFTPVPPPFTTYAAEVEAEVADLLATGKIRPDEADDARFLIVSGHALNAWAAELGMAASR
jgi:hypothetical protein